MWEQIATDSIIRDVLKWLQATNVMRDNDFYTLFIIQPFCCPGDDYFGNTAFLRQFDSVLAAFRIEDCDTVGIDCEPGIAGADVVGHQHIQPFALQLVARVFEQILAFCREAHHYVRAPTAFADSLDFHQDVRGSGQPQCEIVAGRCLLDLLLGDRRRAIIRHRGRHDEHIAAGNLIQHGFQQRLGRSHGDNFGASRHWQRFGAADEPDLCARIQGGLGKGIGAARDERWVEAESGRLRKMAKFALEDPSRRVANHLPGRAFFKGRSVGGLEKWLWSGIDILAELAWYWLVVDVAAD